MASKSNQQKMFSLIEDFSQSDQTQKDFIRQRGISKWKFYYWLRKYRDKKDQESGFVPLEAGPGSGGDIEILFPNGVHLKLPGATGINKIRALIGTS